MPPPWQAGDVHDYAAQGSGLGVSLRYDAPFGFADLYVYDADEAKESKRASREAAVLEELSEKQLDQRVRKLVKELLDAARNLEFERAAHLRDALRVARDRLMEVGGG